MKAIQVQKPGGPEALQFVDIPTPSPKPNECLVQIKASGVNFVDVYFREGRYPSKLPFVSGSEAAGVISEVGSEVKGLKVGDRVTSTNFQGSYAEYSAVAADRLIKIPDGVDFRQASAAMLQGMTAHYLLHGAYPLKRGETALIHAAAGGVGLLLVQMAKRIGARVIGTAGSEMKAELARAAGADEVILYREKDFEAETKRLMGGEKLHVVYDGVGKDTFEKGLNLLRPRGYMVLFGASSGAVPPFDLVRLGPLGSLFITRPTLASYIITREELELRAGAVLGGVAKGELKLRIEHTFPLSGAAQAHIALEGRKTTGKVLLVS